MFVRVNAQLNRGGDVGGPGRRLGVGKEAWTCRRCGSEIPESDFKKGRAVIVLRRAYCGRCTDQVTKPGVAPPQQTLEEAPSNPRV